MLADGIDVQMVSRGPDQGDLRPDQQIPQARFAHGAVRVPSTVLDHGKVRHAHTVQPAHCNLVIMQHKKLIYFAS